MTEITLLDGSIGQELAKRGDATSSRLWSTQVMIDTPELVGAVHDEYFAAGATIATTNSYGLHENRLEREGMLDMLDALVDVSLDQAEQARDRAGGGRIAGSLGPLLASYRPDLDPDPAMAAEKFTARAARLAPRVDLLLIETVSSTREAEGALRGCIGQGAPVWIAFTVSDEDGSKLRSGEDLDAILPLLEQYRPAAVLINCSRPEVIGAALPVLARSNLPYGAYANGFERITEAFLEDAPSVDVLQERRDLTPQAYADHAMSWVGQGATIIGGCCEVGPAHIVEIARRLREAGHKIV
ncbi:homocysteine S-methyltransferase family protein [Sulfitobacter aestuarii]|uniref:Homocysteine S-methyltransferase family protein n=1 Tax=Sulfitobacter aestuarii TaxID=2161676 RepID=A0ABW5U1E9_9RHOB